MNKKACFFWSNKPRAVHSIKPFGVCTQPLDPHNLQFQNGCPCILTFPYPSYCNCRNFKSDFRFQCLKTVHMHHAHASLKLKARIRDASVKTGRKEEMHGDNRQNLPKHNCLRNGQTANPLSIIHFPADRCVHFEHNFKHKTTCSIFYCTDMWGKRLAVRARTWNCRTVPDSVHENIAQIDRKNGTEFAQNNRGRQSAANCQCERCDFVVDVPLSTDGREMALNVPHISDRNQ